MTNEQIKYIAAFAVLAVLFALSVWWLYPKFCDIKIAIDTLITFAAISCVIDCIREIISAIAKLICRQ